MPIIVIIIMAGIGWVIAAIAFEVGYQALGKNYITFCSKGTACRIWWLLLGLCSGAAGPAAFIITLPLLIAIAVTHVRQAHNNDGIITVAEIFRNIGPALRDASARIKPFLK